MTLPFACADLSSKVRGPILLSLRKPLLLLFVSDESLFSSYFEGGWLLEDYSELLLVSLADE